MSEVDSEQIGWQLRAVHLIEKLIRSQLRNELPVLRWSIDSAGCGVVAEPATTSRASREHAVRAWAAHLGLEIREGRPGPGVTNLVGHGAIGDVRRVIIHTTLYDEEGQSGA